LCFTPANPHLGADLGWVRVKVFENARSDTFTLAEKAEEEVLGADVVVAELARFLQRELEHALGTGCKRDLNRHKAAAAPDDLLHLDARLLQADAGV
jgi:hypothetical protein